MNIRLPILAGAVTAMLATPALSMASTISLNGLLTNPSFDGGLQANGCPVGWTCTTTPGSGAATVSATTITAAQYPVPNGLPSGFVPSGSAAAFTPIAPNANGSIYQSVVGEQWTAGNLYTLNFWLGNPLGGIYPSRIDVQLFAGTRESAQTNSLCDTGGRFATLVSGAQSTNDNGTQCSFSITDFSSGLWQPSDGDWRSYTLTFTTNATIAGALGVSFNVFGQQSAANGVLVNLDLGSPNLTVAAVPEPATLSLLGLGLVAATARRRSRRS